MGLVLMRHWLRRLQEVVASEQWPPHLYGVAQQASPKHYGVFTALVELEYCCRTTISEF